MASLKSLADDYAKLKAKIEEQTKALNELRVEILATGRDKINGSLCVLEITHTKQNRLDTKKVKNKFMEEVLEDCYTPVQIDTIRVKARL